MIIRSLREDSKPNFTDFLNYLLHYFLAALDLEIFIHQVLLIEVEDQPDLGLLLVHEYFEQVSQFECSLCEVSLLGPLEQVDIPIFNQNLSFDIAYQGLPYRLDSSTFLLVESLHLEAIHVALDIRSGPIFGLLVELDFAFDGVALDLVIHFDFDFVGSLFMVFVNLIPFVLFVIGDVLEIKIRRHGRVEYFRADLGFMFLFSDFEHLLALGLARHLCIDF